MKNKRQDKILEMVERYDIETQEELISRLRELGFDVTQATISRDIRELKLSKVMTSKGSYKYIVPQNYDGGNLKFKNALSESIVKVDWAMNQIIIKTFPGMAQAIATAIDGINDSQILGCVAGDDAIIVVTRTVSAAETLGPQLRQRIRSLG